MPSEDKTWSYPGKRTIRETDTVIRTGQVTRDTTAVESYWTTTSGVKSRLSASTPGYGLKKLTGSLPENRFGYAEESTVSWQGYEKAGYPWGISNQNFYERTITGVMGTTSLDNPWASDAIIRTNQSNLVKSALAKKIKDSDVDLAVSVGESRETWRMFADTAKVLSNGVKAARSGDANAVIRALGISDLRNFDGVSKKSANAWLMFNYGIKPLINDLNGAVKAFDKGIRSEKYELVRSSNTYEDSKEWKVISSPYDYTYTASYKIETSVRVKYQVTNGKAATLSSLGLTNPATLAWELTKLSFVVDWLIGIGDWLSSMDAGLGKTFKDGSITQFRKIEVVGHRIATKVPAPWTKYQGYADARYEKVACTRTPLDSFPIAYLPGIKDNMGLYHLATSMALLKQLKR